MAYPATISPIRDQPAFPAAVATYGMSNNWVAGLTSQVYVYDSIWYKIGISLPQNSSGGSGHYHLRAFKSTDQGQTWAVVDVANSPEINPDTSPSNISALRSGNTVHTLYQFGDHTANPAKWEFRIAPFDLETEKWGASITGGPKTGCKGVVGSCFAVTQVESGIVAQMVLDPAGTGFIVFFLSQGAGNGTYVGGWDTHNGPYVSSYITCSFAGTWGVQVDFATLNTYGGIPQGAVVAPSGRVHFFFSQMIATDGTYPGYALYECSLFSGIVSGYHLITDTLFPANTCGSGYPRQIEPASYSGNPTMNGSEVMIPLLRVWNTGAATPYDSQANTKVSVAHFTSSASPSVSIKDVTTAANQGPNAGVKLSGATFSWDEIVPTIGMIGSQIVIGWIRSVNTDTSGSRVYTDPSKYYYSQYNGSSWTTPTLAYTTPANSFMQWGQFMVLDSTTAAWVYQEARTGETDFNLEIYVATIPAPPTPLAVDCNNPPDGMVGVAYSHSVAASGGTPPYTFTVFSGALPDGLSLNSSTGEISGTPTVPGPFSYVIQVTDSLAATAVTGTCSVTIAAAGTPSISCNNPPNAYQDVPYSHFFTASGGTPPYTFSIVLGFGSLPTGLSLNASTGEVSGTPIGVDDGFGFRIRVTDFLGATDDIDCVIYVIANPSAQCNNPPAGVVGTAYTHSFSVLNGVAPFTFSLLTSFVPGLSMASNGSVTGIPTTAGTFGFTVRVTDGVGRTSDVVCSIVISAAPGLTLLCNNPVSGIVGEFYSHQIGVSGGVPPYIIIVQTGTFPPGLNIDATGLITGFPTASGTFSFTIQVTDSQTPIPLVDTLTCSIDISDGHVNCPDLPNPQIPGSIVPIDEATERYLRNFINDISTSMTPSDQNS